MEAATSVCHIALRRCAYRRSIMECKRDSFNNTPGGAGERHTDQGKASNETLTFQRDYYFSIVYKKIGDPCPGFLVSGP